MAATGLRSHIWANSTKSLTLLATFPVLVTMLVYAGMLVQQALGLGVRRLPTYVGESFWTILVRDMAAAAERIPSALPWVALGVAVWFVIAWFANVSLISMSTGATGLSRKDAPELYNLLENLCIARGMTTPKLQIIETDQLNAYAAGVTKSQYTVAVTRGLIETLDKDELEAVLAHELSHIIHADVRLAMVSIVFVGIFSLIMSIVFNNADVFARIGAGSSSSDRRDAKGLAVALVLILIAVLILVLVRFLSVAAQMAISRRREFMADAEAVIMTKNPEAMISALRKISGHSDMPDTPSDVRGMYFDNAPGFLGGIFATHPPIRSRITAISQFSGVPEQKPRRSPWG
jgi:heat shock protein HtpX